MTETGQKIQEEHPGRTGRRSRTCAAIALFAACLLLCSLAAAAPAAAAVTVTPSTWNIVGLDSNTPALGPNRFPVGARVCSTTAVTDLPVTLTWDSANPYIDLRPGSLNPVIIPSLAAGGCADAYFEVEVTQTAAAYDTTRRYHISAGGASTPVPRELYVEHLVSQGRNAVTNLEYGTSLASLQSVPGGGSMNLLVGNTYYIRLHAYTATQGYEQLESFINMPNTVFQVLSVETSYSADTSNFVSSPNAMLYADGCWWENDPNSPNYRSCNSEGKVGGTLVVTYQVRIVSVGSGSATLSSLIHDFSGSSFHYNSDYSTSARIAYLIDPATVAIGKSFFPNPTNVNGTSTLTFTLTNPNAGIVSGVTFTDAFPASPGTMQLYDTVTANTCGGTLTDIGGGALTTASTGIRLSNGTIAGYSSCIVQVNVTPSATGVYANTTGHLFLGELDVCKTDNSNLGTCTGSASLSVNTTPVPPPPPAACTTPQELARWTMDPTQGTTAPPAYFSKASDVTTATASYTPRGASTQSISTAQGNPVNSWSATGWYPNPTGPPAFPSSGTAPYVDFTLDTSKYGGVQMSFNYLLLPNGSWGNPGDNMLYVYSSANGGAFSTVYSGASTKNTPWRGPVAAAAASTGSGTTTFRVNATGASKADGTMYLDNIIFTGCTGYPPTISKTFSPNPVAVNGTSILTFTVVNPNSGTGLSGIRFSDTLVSGLSVTAGSSTQCGGTLTKTAPNSISFANGTLAAGASCTITATVTASTAGSHSNVSGFIYSAESGTNTAPAGVASASLTALLPPSMDKQFAPSQILSGSTTTLSFAINNPNQNDALTGVAFSDTFPAAPGAMVVATPAGYSTSGCGTPTFAPAAGAGSISFTNGTIAAASTCYVTVQVTAAAAGTYTNTSGTVSHIVGGATVNGNTASDTLTVTAGSPGISLLKQVGLTSNPAGVWSSFVAVSPGTNVYYKFTVENVGDTPLSPVTVSDPIVSTAGCVWPASLPVAAASNENHIATCVVGPVVAAAGSHVNTATATGTYGGTDYTDTSSATYATINLSFTKNSAEAYYTAAGNVVTYSYVLTNSGSAPLAGPVTIADDRTTVSSPALNTAGDLDNYLDPGESITSTATYTIVDGDVAAKSVTNTATATISGITTAPASKTIRLAPDVKATKANDGNGQVPVGRSFNWTLTVSNAISAGTATFTSGQVLLTDDLPVSGATYSVSTLASLAGGATGTIDCSLVTDSITCSANGAVTMPPGGSFSLLVTAATTTAGSLINPRAGGVCRADPGSVLPEIDEVNNDCSDTVTVRPLPSLTVVKSVTTEWDPVNLASSPRIIPGAIMVYTISVSNTGPGFVDDNTMVVTDAIPPNTILCVSNVCSNPPVIFSCSGAPACGLSFAYGTDVTYSNQPGGGAPYAYTPVPDAEGFDAAVTGVRINPTGPMNGNNAFFILSLKVKVK